MADGVGYTPGAGLKIATRDVPYSDEAMQVQVVGLVTFSGLDDAKVAADVGADNPLPVMGPLTDQQLRDAPLAVFDEMLAQLLVRVISLLGAPVNYDPSLNRERVTAILESGALTTLPTLPEVTNFGTARAATEMQNNQAIAAWAACHAARVF